jgi:hypothetical protein
MRFIADHMLGRLATWLRLLGFDVLYMKNRSNDELLKIAERDSRILLTRDKKLGSKANVLIVKSIFLDSQLEQVVKDLELKIVNPFSRCSVCNSEIVEVKDKNTIESLVPRRIYKEHKQFWFCNSCNKVYWQGSHWAKIMDKVKWLGSLI